MNTVLWLIALVVFLMVEASTVTMVSLWFAVGALAAMIVSLFAGLGWQVGVFLVVSAVALTALRPLVRKYFKPRVTKTNVDAIIGSQGYVTTPIDNMAATGKVKLGAMEWTARSADGSPIPKGTLVKVEKIEGVKVFVTAVKIKTAV